MFVECLFENYFMPVIVLQMYEHKYAAENEISWRLGEKIKYLYCLNSYNFFVKCHNLNLLGFIKKFLICVLKIIENHMGLEWHEGK